jgi:hypothetical protein
LFKTKALLTAMPLTESQQTALDAAVLDYLSTKGFDGAAAAFMEAVRSAVTDEK